MNFRHWYNTEKPPGEKRTMESMTMPNQVLSIHKLLEKHTAGGLVLGREAGYTTDGSTFDTPILGDLNKLDKAGKLQALKDIKVQTDKMQFELQQKSAAAKDAERKRKEEAEKAAMREQIKKEFEGKS